VRGRRLGERRGSLVAVPAPALPRRARPHAQRLTFVERLEPSVQEREDLDTARLVARVQAGDHDAFSSIYMRYFDRVYSYLLVVLAHQPEAEDGAQEVFLRAMEALPRFEQRGQPFRAWLFRTARNYALDVLRRRRRIEPADPHELDRRLEQETWAEDEELAGFDWISDRELMMFVERLPLAQRQALVLRYTADLSDAQIAAIMERTPADVRMLRSRALRFLRARLEAMGSPARSEGRIRMRRWAREAPVLRARRWALR
jgi:RNA polymerase sigma-70 factor (ECF subfamily)